MRDQLAAGCALLLAVACAHTTRTGNGAEAKDANAPPPTGAEAPARKATAGTPPGHPPLAASPAELLQPGSQQKIARALRSKGFAEREDLHGEQLSAAVRKFQKSQGLAETGFPDHQTLLRLGLDPVEVDTSLEGPPKPASPGHDTPPKDENPGG